MRFALALARATSRVRAVSMAAGVTWREQSFGDGLYPEEIDATSDYLRGFFSNVPNFVWQELGAGSAPRLQLPSAPSR